MVFRIVVSKQKKMRTELNISVCSRTADEKNNSGDFVSRATYLVSYIGRVDRDAPKLTVYFEYDADAPNWHDSAE